MAEEQRKTCEWKQWVGATSDVFTTTCGRAFTFDKELTPQKCNLKFCSECGGVLVDFDTAELARYESSAEDTT